MRIPALLALSAMVLSVVFLAACGDITPKGPPVPNAGDLLARHVRVGAVISEEGRAILAKPERVTLHSIEPGTWREYGYGRNTEPTPLAHALAALGEKTGVLGTLQLKKASQREAVREALFAGFIEEGPEAACYDPRHALIYEKGDATVAVLICFECHYAVVLERTTEKGRYKAFQDPQGLKPRLNGLLGAAGIPLAP